jgi:Uma2 family endonuclease
MAEPAYTFDRKKSQTWPAQGEWTYEDYRRLPEDGHRFEVIRGFLYVTPAPILDHQFSVGRLYGALEAFVGPADLGLVVVAPFDVNLPSRIGSPVQPDVMFFRQDRMPRRGAASFDGAPDLVAEVLSPGTRGRDRTIKLKAYQEAGVPEYWLVDPEARTVVIHALGEDGKYTELARGGVGDSVGSSVLPGLRVQVGTLFMP